MQLKDIQPAISKINSNPIVYDLRGHTYISTYPDLINFSSSMNSGNAQEFRQLAMMVYGWMPRVLRIDNSYTAQAIKAIDDARQATLSTYQSVCVKDIANCLHSVVGASKILHFVNPTIFPIWDSKIQAFRCLPNGNYDMSNVSKYFDYVRDVHSIISDPGFAAFYAQYEQAFSNRLLQSKIADYKVQHVRTVESSAFELAP